jgi:hypothetical protein
LQLSVIGLTVSVVALVLAAPADAERPGWYSNPSISGQPRIGATVLGSPGGIKCEPGCVGLIHEWTSCAGSGSGGADRPTGGLPFDGQPAPGCIVRARGELNYVVRPQDDGRHIQLRVIATNYDCGNLRTDGGQECNFSSGRGYSATIGPVAGSVPGSFAPVPVGPRNTASPAVSGSLRVGRTLTAARGAWSGTRPLRFSYRWLRCSARLGGCPPISGARTARYRLTTRDLGARITVVVIASNGAGSMWATAARAAAVRS